MSQDHTIRQLVEELSGAALRDLLRNVRHHTELRRRIAGGEIDERMVNAAYREYARREGPAYRQQAADLTLQYYTELSELGNLYSERFYDEILADGLFAPPSSNGDGGGDGWAAAGGPNGDGGSAAVEEFPVELHGPPGREVVARFGLENTEQHPVRLTIEVGPCRGPDDQTFIAPLSVQPAEAVLAPGERRDVTMRLLMLPSVFVPGYLYRLPVLVHGPEEMRVLVNIWAEEPDVGLRPDANATSPPVPEPEPEADSVSEPDVAGAASEPAPPEPERPPPTRRSSTAKRSASTTSRAKKSAAKKSVAKKSVAQKRADDEPGQFLVTCPGCGREFERTSRTTRLYPHQTPAGDACPERVGSVRVDRRRRGS